LNNISYSIHKQERIVLAHVTDSRGNTFNWLNARQHENRHFAAGLRERDVEWMGEKMKRVELEMRVVKVETGLQQRDEELRGLKEVLVEKNRDIEDLFKLKEILQETRNEVHMWTKREKVYVDEIEIPSARERKMAEDLDHMSKLQRQTAGELERVMARESTQ
jgi:hypothetical protein